MEINKKNRTELKNYFLAGKIPTQQQFAEFIDAGINQMEDGIGKAPGNPIALQVEGDKAGIQNALYFFSSFEDATPGWAINLNPRVDPEKPDSNKPGLNIKDGSGQSRFFIKSIDGYVGIGTIEPTAQLTVRGGNSVPLISAVSAGSGKNILEVTQEESAGVLAVQNNEALPVVKLSGNLAGASYFLNKVGIGNAVPESPLSIAGPGKDRTPNASMHIGNNIIMFGGPNAGKYVYSGRIIADEKRLTIYGIGTSYENTQLSLSAAGGILVDGHIKKWHASLVYFIVYVRAAQSGAVPTLSFGYDAIAGDCFDTTNGSFKAPVDGVYLFTVSVYKRGSDSVLHWTLRLNGTDYINDAFASYPERSRLSCKNRDFTFSRTFIVRLDQYDVITIEQSGDGYADEKYSTWEGTLLQATYSSSDINS